MTAAERSRHCLRSAHFNAAYEAESEQNDLEQLLTAVHLLEPEFKRSVHPLSVDNATLDAWLLGISPSYRLSRAAYLDMGGSFRPELATARRILSSSTLTDDAIAYSPIESELRWTCSPESALTLEARLERLRLLRDFPVNLFHEQNHRLAWRLLMGTLDLRPVTQTKKRSQAKEESERWRRIFNFAEALIVAADVWIETELGNVLSRPAFLAGALFGPGNEWAGKSRGPTRASFHTVAYATYLLLEGYEKTDIATLCATLFGPTVQPALLRAFDLSATFIEHTNPDWQASQGTAAAKALGKMQGEHLRRKSARARSSSKPSLGHLSADARDHALFYDIADTWLAFWEP